VQGSCYINANFVSDKSNDKKKQLYICCQAPLNSTINDFWRMIWEQEVPVIVMITNLVEKNRVKADAYWPAKVKSVASYGDINVKLISEKKKSNQNTVTIRCFQIWKNAPQPTPMRESTKSEVTKDEDIDDYIPTPSDSINSDDDNSINESDEEIMPEEGIEVRRVTQLHCTKWPDFGVPDSAEVMKDLIAEVDIRKRGADKPIVVHCSAGIGRTGTFVAIHMCLQKDLQGEEINISKTVRSLREQRLGMIQSEEQYFFVYSVVHEILRDRLFGPSNTEPTSESHPQTVRYRRMSKDEYPRKTRQYSGSQRTASLMQSEVINNNNNTNIN